MWHFPFICSTQPALILSIDNGPLPALYAQFTEPALISMEVVSHGMRLLQAFKTGEVALEAIHLGRKQPVPGTSYSFLQIQNLIFTSKKVILWKGCSRSLG